MKIVFIAIVVAGILLDVADFISRTNSFLKRKKVESAVPVIGFLIVTVGLVGLRVFSDWISTKRLIILIFLALLFELFMQIIMPLLFMIACNLIYGRKLLDTTALPNKNGKNKAL